ncbi:MAG TPA: hypothetical protein V6D17_21740 [Candidatus Obscuribacterales bacterium]
MYCKKCSPANGETGRSLKTSARKREQGRCEHCGFPVNENRERINHCGLLTDGKGKGRRKPQKYLPPPRKWPKPGQQSSRKAAPQASLKAS